MSRKKFPSTFLTTLRSYTNTATVHGLSYIGDRSLPVIDRLVWMVVVCVFGGCAAYISSGVFKEWQGNKVVTTLKDTEMPITELDFPAITICSEGLNLDTVEKVIEEDYANWKLDQRRKRNTAEDAEIEMFLESTYGIVGDENIMEIISGMLAANPDATYTNIAIRKAMKTTRLFSFDC